MRAEPAWLAQLKAEEERLQREDYERRMSEPLSTGDAMMLGRRVVGR